MDVAVYLCPRSALPNSLSPCSMVTPAPLQSPSRLLLCSSALGKWCLPPFSAQLWESGVYHPCPLPTSPHHSPKVQRCHMPGCHTHSIHFSCDFSEASVSPAPFSPLHQAPHGPSSASSVGSSSFLSEWGMPHAPSLLHFSLLSPLHPATLEFLSHSPQAFNCHLIPVRNLPELPKIYSSSEFSHLPEAQWEMGSSHTFWE